MKKIELTVIEIEKNIWFGSVEGEADIVERLYCDTGFKDAVLSIADHFGNCSYGMIEVDDELYELAIDFRCQKFSATYNEDLVGYQLIFKDGEEAQVQFDKNTNVLDAGFGDWEMDLYEDGTDEDVLEDEDKMDMVDAYCRMMNSLAFDAGKLTHDEVQTGLGISF